LSSLETASPYISKLISFICRLLLTLLLTGVEIRLIRHTTVFRFDFLWIVDVDFYL